jgi:hypothetical protein
MPFVEGVIRLAVRMSGRQWGHSYFYTWAKAEHPSIKLGFTEKRLRVLKTLTEEGILPRLKCGSKRTGCSEWGLGPLARAAIQTDNSTQLVTNLGSEEDLGEGLSLQGVKARPFATIQLNSGVNAPGAEMQDIDTGTHTTPSLLTSIYIGFYSEITPIPDSHPYPASASGLDPP